MQVKDDFLAFLRRIQDGITPEHVQGLREAYGNRDLTGYRWHSLNKALVLRKTVVGQFESKLGL
jgi:hypothetical protein